jgi:hypothetical protein
MWQGQYQTTTDVPASKLFEVICDINNWNKWDVGLEFTKIDSSAIEGASFVLKPKGGPNVKMTLDAVRPFVLIDTAHLFLAKMRTTHEYIQEGHLTTIRFKVEVWGALGFFWRRIIGENQVKEAPTTQWQHSSHMRAATPNYSLKRTAAGRVR